MNELSKSEVKQKIDEYFSKDKIEANETKKIKKIAMTHRISLKDHRKRFCKKCYSDLKEGKARISKEYKQIICNICEMKNRWKLK